MPQKSSQLPSPSKARRAQPDFDLSRWSLENGICWVSGGSHTFAPEYSIDTLHPHPRQYCRRCGQGRDWLITKARDGIVYETAKPVS